MPYAKRFTSLMHVCSQALPLRNDRPQMYSFPDPRRRPDQAAATDEAEFDPNKCDISTAHAAALSPFFWGYMAQMLSLGGPFYCLQVWSRSCHCHRSSDLFGSDIDATVLSYYKRINAYLSNQV